MGAENSLMTSESGATMDQLQASAAMKGALGNQIATLIFRENRVGKSWLYSSPTARSRSSQNLSRGDPPNPRLRR